jgi:hypothetical protein
MSAEDNEEIPPYEFTKTKPKPKPGMTALSPLSGISPFGIDYNVLTTPFTTPFTAEIPFNNVKEPSKYKYSEDETLKEISEYIESTYSGHYVGKGAIQTLDVWETLGSAETSCRDVAIKYLMRYGKKNGHNRKDLLKTIHYLFFLLHYNNKRNT